MEFPKRDKGTIHRRYLPPVGVIALMHFFLRTFILAASMGERLPPLPKEDFGILTSSPAYTVGIQEVIK
jgi:hypothetical protein